MYQKDNYYIHTIHSLSVNAGGPSRSVTGLCSALVDSQTNVGIITRQTNDHDCLPKNTLVDIHKINNSILEKIILHGFYTKLSAISKERKIKLIHDHGLWLPDNFWAAYWAKKNQTPFVLSPRGMLEPWSLSYKLPRKKIALFLYQRKILENTTVFFATSVEEATQIRHLGFKQPIAIIPNGVELHDYHFNKKNMEKKTKNILFLSRIHPKKGLINLVHAWNMVKNPEWRIQIAGNDENNHQQEVLNEIKKLNLEKDFEFLGSVEGSDKSNIYKNAELFILPTFSENFGIVVAEALSYGIPVITTTGTPWSSLIDNQCGWWVEPNAEAIASALKDAMSLSNEQRIQMGDRGINFVKNNFSWDSIAQQTISVYEWILGKSDKPDCIMD